MAGAPAGAAAGARRPLPSFAAAYVARDDAAMRTGTGDAAEIDAGVAGEASRERRGENAAGGLAVGPCGLAPVSARGAAAGGAAGSEGDFASLETGAAVAREAAD